MDFVRQSVYSVLSYQSKITHKLGLLYTMRVHWHQIYHSMHSKYSFIWKFMTENIIWRRILYKTEKDYAELRWQIAIDTTKAYWRTHTHTHMNDQCRIRIHVTDVFCTIHLYDHTHIHAIQVAQYYYYDHYYCHLI